MSAAAETSRMLAALMGVDEDEAAERLQRRVLLTANNDTGRFWVAEIRALIERTILVTDDPNNADVEFVFGAAAPRSASPRLYATINAERAIVSQRPLMESGGIAPHPIFVTAAASTAAAAILNLAISDAALPAVPDPLVVRLVDLGLPALHDLSPINLTGGVLIGAGAVANGFLKALRHLPVCGTLDVLDPKRVGPGNPNRCLYFADSDIGAHKAIALATNASGDFPHLELVPKVSEFKEYAAEKGKVHLAIVSVDSRRARRQIQKFVPGIVVDASTTDVRGVVIHSHVQPTSQACLACIYKHVPDEAARERSIAEGLGISIAEVKQGFINEAAAAAISRVHPGQNPVLLVGKAYDTLFRELCAAQALRTPEGRQVFTPFAFVSSLAGTLLAVELVRRSKDTVNTNYWQIDPWRGPRAQLRRRRSRLVDCEFCSKPEADHVIRDLWGTQSTWICR